MKVVNFFGGPGSCKSTLAAGLFYEMKRAMIQVELVTEYAKDLTWDKRFYCLTDQVAILGQQNNRLRRLEGQVDYVVSDSALVLGLMYKPENYYKNFDALILEMFSSYDNINFLIERPQEFTGVGRNQDKEESMEIDGRIQDMLIENKIPYEYVNYAISATELMNIVLNA